MRNFVHSEDRQKQILLVKKFMYFKGQQCYQTSVKVTVEKAAFCLYFAFMFWVGFSKWTSILFLNHMNNLGSLLDKKYILCEVRAVLCSICLSLSSQGHAVAMAARCRSFVSRDRDSWRQILNEICGGKRGKGTGLCQSTSAFPLIVIAPVLHTYLHFNFICIRRTSGQSLGTVKWSDALSNVGGHWAFKGLIMIIICGWILTLKNKKMNDFVQWTT